MAQYGSGFDADGDGCLDHIPDLRVIVIDLDLEDGLENALVSKLDSAQDALDRGNNEAAINKLLAFINQVEAQRGKKIKEIDADLLIAFAWNIINQIPVTP